MGIMARDLMKMNLALLSKKELSQHFATWAEPKFRAEQVFRWIWKEKVFDFNLMTNLSKKLRDRLLAECEIVFPKIIQAQKSEDGTIKYLLSLQDFRTVETVWIPSADKSRVTVCISTQVGCKMGCTFCLTAQQKVERNLTAGEIAAQILVLPNSEEVSNVVVMGMGEPFDNYDNLMGALDTITDVQGLEIGPKHVTVSTSGLVPKMKQFISESRCRLAVSLNAPNDEIRNKIMPINKAYPLDVLLGALREVCKKDYPKPAASRFYITFEYILIRDLNDKVEHANEVVRRLHGIPAKVNVLLYNENPNVPFKRPTQDAVDAFRATLSKKGLLNFIRNSRGRDISAACGQLVSEHKRSMIPLVQIDTHGAI
jgi:23S rRNA (adenine2503-C2)-methyltransferase